MSGNLIPLALHNTFQQKISNFPEDVYDFNEGDNLTTLMKTLLGNSGTGQLATLQTVARLGQQQLEFSNLDAIMGAILDVRRLSTEAYSFATNPFIDQLNFNQWQEVLNKDSSYRERLLSAAEGFQLGSTVWGIMTLCEAATGIHFRVLESWRTPGVSSRPGLASNSTEVVLVPILDDSGLFTWDQGKAREVLRLVTRVIPINFVVSFGTPITLLTQVPLHYVTSNSYSEFFHLSKTVSAGNLSAPGTTLPGSNTRYWLQSNVAGQLAPTFAHLTTQEGILDLTGNIGSVTSSDSSSNPEKSISLISVNINSTVYGNQ